ncbi:MAG: hypothetical protein RLZZ292_997 [Bacteroidota bacterium]
MFSALVCFFFACTEKENSTPPRTEQVTLSVLQQKIEAFKQDPYAGRILVIESQGELVYWFAVAERSPENEAPIPADYPEPVYNEKGEQVCMKNCECEYVEINCPENPASEWKVIWKK